MNEEVPWFGAFALSIEENRQVEYKIGERRNTALSIVDWRHPLAAAFYNTEPGEEFELDVPGYVFLNGVSSYKATSVSRNRSIVKLELLKENEFHIFVRHENGELELESEMSTQLRDAGLPDVRALLSTDQYKLITQSRSQPVVIQGRAGSGKTTVALYRVSWLTFADESSTQNVPVDPARVLIVMFNKALQTFIEKSIVQLKLDKAEIRTFHAWALGAVKRAYRGTLDVDLGFNILGQSKAASIKKKIGMIHAIDEFVDSQTKRAQIWLEKQLQNYKAEYLVSNFSQMKDPVARRLIRLRKEALLQRNSEKQKNSYDRWDAVYSIFQKSVERMTLYKEDLWNLLKDKSLLMRHLSDCSEADIDEMIKFQRTLQEVDANGHVGSKVTFEDLALLLRFIELKHGGLSEAKNDEEVFVYDHLLIDEAQDFGAVELRVLLDTVRTRAGVTIVGDTNQKIIPDADFVGWEALIGELGVEGAKVAQLSLAHRSTGPIMALADNLVGDVSQAGRTGARPSLLHAHEDDAFFERLVEDLQADVKEHPMGHHCVICPQSDYAKVLLDRLKIALPKLQKEIRIGHKKEFVFEPGITITNVQQIKGLEFDSVLIIGVNSANYPETLEAQRNLYTSITRARERLRIYAVGELSPLLTNPVALGLLDLTRLDFYAPATFTEEDDMPF